MLMKPESQPPSTSAHQARAADRRQQRRFFISNPGRLIAPEIDVECTLINISGCAAKVSVQCPFPPGQAVVLDIEEIGRFYGSVLRRQDDELIVQFDLDGTGRSDLVERIEEYLNAPQILRR